MTNAISLSHAKVQTGIRRIAPRPLELRNEFYEGRFDWSQLFYDVYRVGDHIVMQGPPMLGFLEELQKVEPFRSAFRWPFPKAQYCGQRKRGEIWLKSDADRVSFDCALGQFDLSVQPNESQQFAGKRVIVTLSLNNEIRWIVDWLRFHQRLHGADAALFYDNGSTIYTRDELQMALETALPDMTILVISWPFIYGPQGGEMAIINGIEPDWDSDFCQIGVLQHARFRFLQSAKSVMHNDIDELVIGANGRSVFEAAEQSRTGLVKFDGRWISAHSDHPIDKATHRHADYIYDEGAHVENSPPKWCIRPNAFGRDKSWGVHNIFDTKANNAVTDEFLFRHFRGVTTNWKYDRSQVEATDKLILDHDLCDAMQQAGLARDAAVKGDLCTAA